MTDAACGCKLDEDPDTEGVIVQACQQHSDASCAVHWQVRKLLDAELDSVVCGKGHVRSRPVGVMAAFPVSSRSSLKG